MAAAEVVWVPLSRIDRLSWTEKRVPRDARAAEMKAVRAEGMSDGFRSAARLQLEVKEYSTPVETRTKLAKGVRGGGRGWIRCYQRLPHTLRRLREDVR